MIIVKAQTTLVIVVEFRCLVINTSLMIINDSFTLISLNKHDIVKKIHKKPKEIHLKWPEEKKDYFALLFSCKLSVNHHFYKMDRKSVGANEEERQSNKCKMKGKGRHKSRINDKKKMYKK